MIDRFVRIVFSKWYLLVGIVLLALLTMPANSPIPLSRDYKVVPAVGLIMLGFKVMFPGERKV